MRFAPDANLGPMWKLMAAILAVCTIGGCIAETGTETDPAVVGSHSEAATAEQCWNHTATVYCDDQQQSMNGYCCETYDPDDPIGYWCSTDDWADTWRWWCVNYGWPVIHPQ